MRSTDYSLFCFHIFCSIFLHIISFLCLQRKIDIHRFNAHQRSLGPVKGRGAVRETFNNHRAKGAMEKVPMHFVQLDCDLRKRVREGQYFRACHATRRSLRRTIRRDATRRTYHPRERRPTVAFSICLSAPSSVLPIAEQHDRRAHRDVSPSSSMTYMSFRGDSAVHAKCYNHRSFRGESSPAAGRVHPLPPLAVVVVVVVVVSLALDTRTTATYTADDSSLLFQASRGSGSAVESASVSRWILSRAIIQSPAEIISANARLTDCRWTSPRFHE